MAVSGKFESSQAPLASIAQAHLSRPQLGVQTPPVPLGISGAGTWNTSHKTTTTCSAKLPRKSKPVPPGNKKGALGPRDVARRWLTGIGIGAGGVTFFGPFGNSAAIAGQGPSRPAAPPKRARNDSEKRILILMSNTGGGHKASADALEAGFKELYGKKYKIDIVDAWKEHTPMPFNQMPNSYSFLVKNPILWRVAYLTTQPRIIHKPYMWSCGNFIGRGMNDLFNKYEPDLVVSVHPLMQHIPIRVLQQRIRNGIQDPIHFSTVVTDFTTCSNMWFHKGVSTCFVPTDECHRRARRMGLSNDQISQYGLPIRPAFSRPLPPKFALRSKLGMSRTLPAVLLVGGGEGMGKLEQTVKEIAKLGTKCQVVVICGRNQKLQNQLETGNFGDVQLHARGFVSNMHEYMGACDAVITKAGPGTIAEALILGLPILLNGNVPCQEEGNIPYVVDNKCGAFERKPKVIARILDEWFSESGKPLLQEMKANCLALGRPGALFQIVKDLATLTVHPELATKQAVVV